jgi:hypothetical protein
LDSSNSAEETSEEDPEESTTEEKDGGTENTEALTIESDPKGEGEDTEGEESEE